MAEFYSEGDIINIDLFKAIQYFYKCPKINNNKIIYNDSNVPEIKDHNFIITNKYRYQSYNNLGLIYLTVFEDFEKSHSFIKEAAFAEFPYGQNNLGLLNQFYLNNIEYAEYMYKRSSMHNFALAHYNLGYLKEKENKTVESILSYLKASENEDMPLIFHNFHHVDKRLEISKTFVICLTNLKLVEYYFMSSNFNDAKNYFIKVFSKLKVEKEDTIYKFGFDSKGKTTKNCFEYLKDFILNFPLFNLTHQPNINLN